jgi:hypothetical protein
VDARRTPRRILRLHAPDQPSDFGVDLRLPRSTATRPPTPEKPKSSTIPGNHSIWLDDNQRLRPVSPKPTEHNQNNRSNRSSLGRGCLRFHTASCCEERPLPKPGYGATPETHEGRQASQRRA